MLPLSSGSYRPAQPAIAQATGHYMPKQEAMSPPFMDAATLQTDSQSYIPCSAIENWTSSSGTDPVMASQHLNYANPSWTVGTPHGLLTSHTTSELLAEATDRPFDFAGSQLSGVPTTMASYANTSQLKPKPRSLGGCRDSMDWPLGPSHQNSSEGAMASNTMGFAPPSPAYSVPSSHSLQFSNSGASPVKSSLDLDEMRASSGAEEDGSADPPYSLLIYQALRSAPDKKLPLQGIYSWFEKNTEKGKDQSSKGWQNSIRHNLSMNAGFEAVKEGTGGGKKTVNFWRLTDEAVKNGIQSTTRYRKQANCRKALSLEPPAPQRQRSGARGGKAAKVTAKFRHGHTHHDELRRDRPYPYRSRLMAHRRPEKEKDLYLQTPPSGLPLGVPFSANTIGHSVETFDLRHVVGCTDYSPTTPLFCDMDAAESDYFTFGVGSLGWCGIHSAATTPNGFWAGPEISTDLHIGV